MGIVCKGFDGVLTEYDWAQMSGLMGNMPSVKGPDDFSVGTTIQGNTVLCEVLPGQAWAHGVMCTSSSVETVTEPLPGPGKPRYDYVVLSRDWQENTAKLEIVPGGSSERARDVLRAEPGVYHQQLLATLVLSSNGLQQQLDRRAIAARVAFGESAACDPTPVEGDRVMVPSGAVWANHADEWMLLSPRIETGTKSITFGGSNVYSYTIPFGRQFTSPPVVVASMSTAAGGTTQIDVKAYNVTAKDFGLAFITNDGSKPSGVPAVANWIAVGV